MSEYYYRHCSRCGKALFFTYEKCQCQGFIVAHISGGETAEDASTLYGNDIEDAIERHAKSRFWEDPGDPSHVEEIYEHNGKQYIVTAEASVDFYVKEK